MGHGHHHHHHADDMSERKLLWAVGANMALTCAQVIGGMLSGSLSLIADALHNFSDAASLLIALIAIRIGKKPPDKHKTFGYKRAETVAALINLTSLVLIGVYLCYEAVTRFFSPEPVQGWLVIAVAGIALVVDLFTAWLTYKQSKHSMNMRAAFLHNMTDALASVGVIISGALILQFGWVWTDAAMTLLISAYVLWHGFSEMPKVIHLLMEGAPQHISMAEVIAAMEQVSGVENVHHVHLWQPDESRIALEAHMVVRMRNLSEIELIKSDVKRVLREQFSITHSTLEIETPASECV